MPNDTHLNFNFNVAAVQARIALLGLSIQAAEKPSPYQNYIKQQQDKAIGLPVDPVIMSQAEFEQRVQKIVRNSIADLKKTVEALQRDVRRLNSLDS